MLRGTSFLFLAGLIILLQPVRLYSQVPDVEGTCVYNCGGDTDNVSDARARQIARDHAEHAKQVRWFNEVDYDWQGAVRKGNKLSEKGQKALAKHDCAKALDDFQRELAAFSINLTSRGQIWDAVLSGKYNGILYRQQSAISHAQNRISGAEAVCAPRQNFALNQAPISNPAPLTFNPVHASAAAAPRDNAQQAPRNLVVEPVTYGVVSCYRADPAKTSCFELRNNSNRRMRLYVDGMPGVQCTVDPLSYCSLPLAIGRAKLRMVPDDENGVSMVIGEELDIAPAGTRVTVH